MMDDENRTLLRAIILGKIRRTKLCRRILREAEPLVRNKHDADLLDEAQTQFLEGWRNVDPRYFDYDRPGGATP
jgi:hypothetical protein